MPATIRTGCVICGRAFVKGDYPNIVAQTTSDDEQIAAHRTCWDAMEQAAEELGKL